MQRKVTTEMSSEKCVRNLDEHRASHGCGRDLVASSSARLMRWRSTMTLNNTHQMLVGSSRDWRSRRFCMASSLTSSGALTEIMLCGDARREKVLGRRSMRRPCVGLSVVPRGTTLRGDRGIVPSNIRV